jgi:hypothetical protein
MARTLAECENDRYEAMQVRSNMNWEDHAVNLMGSNSYAYFSLVIVSGATER